VDFDAVQLGGKPVRRGAQGAQPLAGGDQE